MFIKDEKNLDFKSWHSKKDFANLKKIVMLLKNLKEVSNGIKTT